MKYILAFFIVAFSFVNGFSTERNSVCDISNVTLAVLPCDSTDQFFVQIEFDVVDPGSMGFRIQGNGIVYDSFEYGQAPYTVGPLDGDCVSLYEFAVVDLEDNNCSGAVELNTPVCCPKQCELNVDDLVVMDCDTSGQREILFSITTENSGSLGFDLYFQGVLIQHYNYGQQNYMFTIPGYGFTGGFEIRDTEFPDCSDRLEFNALPCPGAEPCNPLDFEIMTEFVCTSDTTYNAVITVGYTGNDDSLYVSLDNEPAELRAFKDFPVTYFNLPAENVLHTFFVHEQDNPFCFSSTAWDDSPDCSNFFQCEISNVIAELHECPDSTNQVFVDIAFDVVNPVSDSFLIRGNGVVYDSFAYGQAFYTVGPIDANCMSNYEFIVIDLDDPDCRGETVFAEAPCCECRISDLILDPGNCSGDGTYELFLDFEFENETNEFFNVYSEGNLVGTFRYSDLPVTINDFPERDAAFDIITVCDNDNPDCCTTVEFQGPDCLIDECEIFNVFAEATQCNDEGELFVTLEFDYDNTGNSGFMIVGNGVNYGNFQYGLTSYVVGPIVPDCNLVYEFAVIDIDDPDCSDFFVFNEPLCCEEEECDIYNINIDPVMCTGDGLYSLFLNFEFENPGSNSFQVFSQGQLIGTFAYSNLPVFVNNFPEREVDFDIITVCDSNNPDCCETLEFIGLDCMEEEEECAISELIVDPIECTGDGTYSVYIEFNYENADNDFFDVYSGNTLVGTFPLANVPLIINDFPERDAVNDLIEICINDNPMCCIELEFDGLDCEIEEICSITEINVDPVACTGDGIYSAFVDFNYDNVTADSFEVHSSATFLGVFAFSDLPVFIDNIPDLDAEFDNILICVQDNDSCCNDLLFQGLDCMEEEGDCLISNINVDPVECTGEGQYSLFLNFDFENVSNDFFDVLAEGSIIGSFAYSDLPVFIDNFPESDTPLDFILVCDNDNPTCCTAMQFAGLDCSETQECEINEVFAEATECNEDGQVFVDIEFDVVNPESASFLVRGNGVIYDTFQYGEPFYTVGPIAGDCSTIYEFVIIDLENENCSGAFVFDGPICCPDDTLCEISNVVAEVYPCDENTSEVLVDIAFNAENVSAAGFTVRGNGVIYDTFQYGEPFYTVGPIDADCETLYEFVITDLEHPDCSSSFVFDEAPCCEDDIPCEIGEIDILDAELINGLYIIVLDVNAQAGVGAGFDILINDVVVDAGLYADLPVILQVSQNEFEVPFDISVCDSDHPDCCNSIEFEFTDAVLERLDPKDFSIVQMEGQLLIETDLEADMTAHIVALDGRSVFSREFRYQTNIDTGNVPSGLYILFIESKFGVLSKKVFLGY